MKLQPTLFAVFVILSLHMASTNSIAQTQSHAEGKWIDVTAPLDPATTPVYPGNAPLKFEFSMQLSKGDPVTLSTYQLGAHAGTHIDAPMHFIKGGAPINEVSLSHLIGPARVIDCTADAKVIDAAELNKHDWKGAKRLLFRTRNSRNKWMTDPTFHKDFTYIAPDAAKLLADAGVELVGIDYLSAEVFDAKDPATHRTLLGQGIPIVEGLDLTNVEAGNYQLIILPLRIVGHEAAPARAILRKQ
ncbi:MAG TPA: cyclase family protein [Terriglobales bacterium]